MKYLILGAGAAGMKAAEKLRTLDKSGSITVAAEDSAVYSRCMLHQYIAGTRTAERLNFMPASFFEKNSVEFIGGTKTDTVDFGKKCVLLKNEKTVFYDRLLIATGARASVPPIPGLSGAQNVFVLRDMEDAEKIKTACGTFKKAVVIGGGLVGMDAVQAMLIRGLKVDIVEMGGRILPLQLDDFAAGIYKKRFEDSGARFFTGTAVKGAKQDENGHVCKVILASGEELDCDFVVAAAGVRPNVKYSEKVIDTAPKTERGIVVDEHMRTTVPDVYAAGDVTGISGLFPLAIKQGITAASNMAGQDVIYTDTFSKINSMNFCGIPAISIGEVNQKDDADIRILHTKGVYKKFVIKDGALLGTLLVGDIDGGGFYTSLVKKKIPLKNVGKPWDESYADHFAIDESGRFSFSDVPKAV